MRRSRLAASVLTCSLLSLALATAARADNTPSPSDRETARTLMTQGLAQRKNGDLSSALTSFRNADAIMHVTTTALEVARTEEAMGQLIEARDEALAAMRVPPKPNESSVLKDGRTQLAALAEALEPRIPSLQIALQGVPSGAVANVQMDREDLPSQTLAVARRVNPGHHVITADAGTAHGKLELDLAERETKVATVTLAEAAPVASTPVPEGGPKKKSDPLLIAGFAGLGLGAAGLVVGGVTGYLSLHKTSTLKSECPNDVCPGATYDSSSFQSERTSARTFGTVSTIGFIAGGVFAAAGATFLVLRAKAHHEDDAKAPAAFVIGPGFAYGSF